MLEPEIDKVLSKLKALPIIKNGLAQLQKELPSHLVYHAYAHTEDVLAEAIRFAVVDCRSDRDLELLAIAATYHDAGFIQSPAANEPIGAQMALQAMKAHGGYSSEETTLVEQMILDTTLKDTLTGPRQVPSTDLSRYLLDADLSNFGREDFFDKGELQRQELGYDQEVFRRKSFELLNAHRWLTNAARSLRQTKKEENILLLKKMIDPDNSATGLSFDRLGFLAKLPLLLNSSLDTKRIIKVALEELKKRLCAEAATIFLLDDGGAHVTFWALQGSEAGELEGVRMPAEKGIVGWVIEQQESVRVDDVAKDPRFFSQIDRDVGFKTLNMVCSPLTVRGERRLGAVQVLNRTEGQFSDEDLIFLDQFSHQMALAIDNARLFEAVQERNRQLEILDHRKNEMISVIAHEFRTPLNLIGTSAEMLGSGALNDVETVEKMCGILNKGVQRLTKLIGEIRNLSLSTTEKLDVHSTKFLTRDLIAQAAENFEIPAKQRKIKFVTELADDVGHVEGDFALLMIVLRNLISNAIRFTPDLGQVKIKAARTAGVITIEVADTGVGIPPEQISLIFEKFYEVGNALHHTSGDFEFKSGGLGLGLATVRAILKAHGTTCDVKSTLNKGSTFSFSLTAL